MTCSADYGPGQTIVGTARAGLRTFDGKSFSDVTVPKILGPGRHINDLCQVGTDLYAAAVDTTGIVFFDRGGRIVQVLNRTLDHRLARVRRLVYSRNGVLWALLDNAVACVQFPSPISNFEPLLASAMNYAKPLRHQGELWIMADGRLMRGVYSPDGYLERFELDTPPGRFLWAIAETGGRLFATNEEGIFVRERHGLATSRGRNHQRAARNWPRPDPTDNSSMSRAARSDGSRNRPGGMPSSAYPSKDLARCTTPWRTPRGRVWLELGTSRVGRVEFGAGEPTVRFFGKDDGLGEGWVNLFVLDGIVRCNTARHLLSFDARTQRFAEDRELIHRIPTLAGLHGPAGAGRVRPPLVCFTGRRPLRG